MAGHQVAVLRRQAGPRRAHHGGQSFVVTPATLRRWHRQQGGPALELSTPDGISRLVTNDLTIDDRHVLLKLGSTPIELPEPLASHARTLLATCSSCTGKQIADPGPWLFPATVRTGLLCARRGAPIIVVLTLFSASRRLLGGGPDSGGAAWRCRRGLGYSLGRSGLPHGRRLDDLRGRLLRGGLFGGRLRDLRHPARRDQLFEAGRCPTASRRASSCSTRPSAGCCWPASGARG